MSDDAPSENQRIEPHGLALSPDGALIAAQESPDRTLLGLNSGWGTTLWDTRTGEIVRRLRNGLIGAIAWHPDGEVLAAGGQTTIDITDTEGNLRWTLMGHKKPRRTPALIRDLAFHPDGSMLASLSSDGTARVWSLAKNSCEPERTLNVRRMTPLSLSFTPDGSSLVITGPGGVPERWDPKSGSRIERLSAITGAPYGVTHQADGAVVVGTDKPPSLLIRTADGTVANGPEPLSQRPLAISVNPVDGRLAVGGQHDNQVMVWNPATDEREDLPRVRGSVGRLAWSPAGDVLYGACPLEGVTTWDGRTWKSFDLPED